MQNNKFSNQSRPQKRPSLREDVIALDREILNLLLRRYNLLQRLKGSRGHLIPSEEKELRSAWQTEASRFSQDPKLISQFFNLMQDLTFFPKPSSDSQKNQPARPGFNLAPAHKAINFKQLLPLDTFDTQAHLLTAAFSGQSLELDPCLLHDGQLALIRSLKELGAPLSTANSCITLGRKSAGLSVQDLSLHVGCDLTNFYFLAAQYLVRPSRIRFTAEGQLKYLNLTPLAHFLPQLGARLTYGVPKSHSFPIRLECSAVLPAKLQVPAHLPKDFVLALILALPFAEDSMIVDLSQHPSRAEIKAHALDLLSTWQAQVITQSDYCLKLNPCKLSLPERPKISSSLDLTCFVLCLPLSGL